MKTSLMSGSVRKVAFRRAMARPAVVMASALALAALVAAWTGSGAGSASGPGSARAAQPAVGGVGGGTGGGGWSAATKPSTPSRDDVSGLRPPTNGPRRLDPTSPVGVGAGRHALVNATVHAEPGVTLTNATILIVDGVIRGVRAEVAASDVPAGFRVHDLKGLHVYPGFIDAFVEVDAPRPDPNSPGAHWSPHVMPQRSVLDGPTGSRAAAGFGGPPIDDKTAEQLRKMGFTAAGLSPRGGVIRGRAAAVSLGKMDRDPAAEPPPVYGSYAYMAVGLDRGEGGGWGGRGASDESRWSAYPGSQMGAIALIRQTLLDAAWRGQGEATRSDDWIKGPKDALAAFWPMRRERGPAGSAAGADQWVPLAFDVGDELEALRAIRIGREFDRGVVVIGSGREFRRLSALAREAKDDGRVLQGVVLPLNYPQRPRVDTLGKADSVDLEALMDWEQGPTNPRRLDEAGVRVALTTGKVPERAGGRGVFWKRLGEAIKHGLPKERALAMLTTHPAMVLGVSDRLGTIGDGKVASLVVADGDLFDHAPDRDAKKHKPAKVLEVWIDGRRHEIEARKKHELEGTWAVEFTEGALASPGALVLEVDAEGGIKVVKLPAVPAAAAGGGGDADAPARAGEAGEPDGPKQEAAKPARQESKARDVKLMGDRLTFVFEHEPFGSPGVFRSEAIVEADSTTGERVLHGLTVRAGGEVMRWTARKRDGVAEARRHEGEEKKDGEKKEEDEERGTPEADDIAAVPEALLIPHGGHGREAYPEQKHVLIIGGTVWTCDEDGRVIEDGVVRIHNGKIVFVGTRGEWADVAARARFDSPWEEVDATGKHVTPGLIDAHSHTGISKGVNEAGQAVTAEVRIGDVTDPDSISWYRQLAGGTTTVNSMHGSANPIGGQTQTNKIRWGVEHPDGMHMEGAKPGIKFALGENVKQSNWGDNNRTRYPQTRMGVETIIRDRFTAAREYAKAGNKPRSHGATKGPRVAGVSTSAAPAGAREAGASDGRHQDLPGSDRVAAIDGSRREDLLGNRANATGGTVRADDADASGGDLHSIEHRGGARAAVDRRLSAVSQDRSGIDGRTDDPVPVGDSDGDDHPVGFDFGVAGRDGPDSAGADTLDAEVRAAYLIASSASPSWLRGSVAPWLTASVPTSLRALEPRPDLELDALVEILAGERLVHCHSYRQDEILMLARLAQEFGFTIGTYQHGLECYKVADEVRESAIGASIFTDWWAFKMEVQDAIPHAGPILHDRGVNLSFNSDSDELARRMNGEAAKGVKYASPESPISPATALRFVTINPARQLGIDGRVGSLESGKDADVVVWSGPPLSSLSRCERTYVDGRLMFSLEDDRAMRERIARERARLIQKVLAQEAREKGAGRAGGAGRGRRGDVGAPGPDSDPAGDAEEGTEEAPPELARSGRGSLMRRMNDHAAIVRREHYLHLLQRGLDPRFSRCGDCGQIMGW